MIKLILDANEEVVGRLGSYVAKQLLRGNEVAIVNAEKAIISGNREGNIERVRRWRMKGGSSQKGPLVSKMPDRLLKRMIRGMLPWDRTKGVEAWKRLKCYVGVPAEFKNAQKLNTKKPAKYISLKEICELL